MGSGYRWHRGDVLEWHDRVHGWRPHRTITTAAAAAEATRLVAQGAGDLGRDGRPKPWYRISRRGAIIVDAVHRAHEDDRRAPRAVEWEPSREVKGLQGAIVLDVPVHRVVTRTGTVQEGLFRRRRGHAAAPHRHTHKGTR